MIPSLCYVCQHLFIGHLVDDLDLIQTWISPTDWLSAKIRIQPHQKCDFKPQKKHHFFRIEPTKVWTSCKPQTKRSVSWANGAKPPKIGLVVSKRAHPKMSRLKIGDTARNLERPPKLLPYPTAVPFWLRLRSHFVSATDRGQAPKAEVKHHQLPWLKPYRWIQMLPLGLDHNGLRTKVGSL